MCAKKWLTPATASLSSREPVRTKKPTLAEWASSFTSASTSKPLGNLWLRNSNGYLQRFRAERDDEHVPRWILAQKAVDAFPRQRVDQSANFVERACAAQVVPLTGQRSAAGRRRFLLHNQRA